MYIGYRQGNFIHLICFYFVTHDCMSRLLSIDSVDRPVHIYELILLHSLLAVNYNL